MPLPTLREREREPRLPFKERGSVHIGGWGGVGWGGKKHTCCRGALYLPGAMGSNTSDNSGIIPPRPLIYYRYFFLLFLKEFKGWISTQITQTKAPLIRNAALREMLLLSRGHPEACRAQMNPLRRGEGRRRRRREGKTISKGSAFGYLGWEGRTDGASGNPAGFQSSGLPCSDALIEEAAAAA